MRKITTSLVGLMMLLTACSKKDIKVADAEPVVPEMESARQCASSEVLDRQISEDPKRADFLAELEEKTRLYAGRENGIFRGVGMLYIPVVIHVVSSANVTDAQIQRQIDVLNKDFTKTNSELSNSSVYLANYSFASVANCQINFVVTQVIRRSTTATFGTNDAVKKTSMGGSDPVNATTHLNFWVADLSSGLLGYAQFPGGSASTDGIVVDYQAFGTAATYAMYSQFNLGRTATHEVGHWVNLRHIWGDTRCGNDQVTDTPAHDGSNGGCPAVGLKSACQGKPLEQWMNYMDYTDDRCMYMFSGGQKTRIDAAVDGARLAYVRTTKPTPATGFQ